VAAEKRVLGGVGLGCSPDALLDLAAYVRFDGAR
jgi:hypothetical protein